MFSTGYNIKTDKTTKTKKGNKFLEKQNTNTQTEFVCEAPQKDMRKEEK